MLENSIYVFISGNLHFTYLTQSDILSGVYNIYKVDVFNSIIDNTAGGSYTKIVKKAGEVFRYYIIDVWAFCSSMGQLRWQLYINVCVSYFYWFLFLGAIHEDHHA